MRVVTLNLNGIRSALKKGLAEWLTLIQPDLLFLQEIRASNSDWEHAKILPNYTRIINPALKPGYSGVALFSRYPLNNIKLEHHELSLTDEGRFIEAQIGPLTIINLYCPSGSSGPERQLIKLRYLKELSSYVRSLKKPILIAGDFNIAHTIHDLKNWKQNFMRQAAPQRNALGSLIF